MAACRRFLVLLGFVGFLYLILLYFPFQRNKSHEKPAQGILALQILRKQLLRELCDEDISFSEGKQSLGNISSAELSNLMVDDYNGIIYCFIPKAASTNWKRVMLVLSNSVQNPDPMSMPHDIVHKQNNLNLLSRFTTTEIKARLKHYTKFLFVRNPFVRLISTYRDKFQQLNEDFYQNFARGILQHYSNQPNPPKTAGEAFASNVRPSFHNFIEYLVDPEKEINGTFNTHWRQMYDLCHPCFIQYDFIGHQETLQEDAELLLKILNVGDDIKFPPAHENMTSPDSVLDWFRAVPLEDRRKLYKLYEADFRLFAYGKPVELLDGRDELS